MSTTAEPDRDPAGILLDLDGTLVDTVAARVRSWREAFAAEGIEVSEDELGPWMGADGRWLSVEVAATHGHRIDADTADRLDRVSGERFARHSRTPAAIPGARDLLVALTDWSVPWAVATSSRPEQTIASLASLRLDQPPMLVDASHVERAKPEPDLLLAGAAQLGVPPSETWYVGDSRWDMLAAVRADMTPVAVTTGATDAATLRDAGAAWVIEDLGTLTRHLAGLRDRAR
jgi:HAD superfamily hydrolase (TIGR01509 family)